MDHDDPQGTEEAVHAEENGVGVTGPAVFDRLRRQYEQPTEDRRLTLPIAPARYNGNLAALYKAIPYERIRKLERRFNKIGGSEAELNFKSAVVAEACIEILYRFEDGEEMKPMHEPVPEFSEPVRYDDKLMRALGIPGDTLHPEQIVRLVFKDPLILEGHFAAYDAWRSEALKGDDEEEDDDGEGGDRPT